MRRQAFVVSFCGCLILVGCQGEPPNQAPMVKELAVLKGHKGDVVSLAFSPDGKLLASGGGDSAGRLWDVVAAKELAAFGGAGAMGLTWVSLAFSPDGKTV